MRQRSRILCRADKNLVHSEYSIRSGSTVSDGLNLPGWAEWVRLGCEQNDASGIIPALARSQTVRHTRWTVTEYRRSGLSQAARLYR